MELETSCLREPVLEFSSIRSTGCKLQQRVIFLPQASSLGGRCSPMCDPGVRLKILISP